MFDVLFSSKLFEWDFDEDDHFAVPDEVVFTHQALLDRLNDPTDPFFALEGTTPAISATQITWGDITGDALRISGTGLDQVSDLEQLLADLEDLTTDVTATFDTFEIYLAGTLVAELTLTDTSAVLVTGDQTIALTGMMPHTLQEIWDFVGNVTFMATDPDAEAQIDDLIAFFASYALDGFSITDAGETLFSLTETATHVTLEVAGATLELTGSFLEGNIGGHLAALTILDEWLSAPALERPATFGLNDFPGLDLTAITLTDMNGLVLFEMTGDFAGLEHDPNGDLIDPDGFAHDVTVEGTDGRDDIYVPDFRVADGTQSITANGGGGDHDWFDIETHLWRSGEVAPTQINGDGWGDTLHINDRGFTGDDGVWGGHFYVDWAFGELWGFDDADRMDFLIGFSDIHTLQFHAQGDLIIDGDDNDNQVDLHEAYGFFEFNGGGGTDAIDVQHMPWLDAGGFWHDGFTLDEFQAFYTYTVNPDTSIDLFIAHNGLHAATVQDVEIVRLNSPDGNGRWEVSVSELLGNSTLEGTEGDDRLQGFDVVDTIYGYGGRDDIRDFHGDNTIDAGPGSDTVRVGTGNHDLDGGTDSDWDRLHFEDFTSEVVIVDFPGGTVTGQDLETDPTLVHYQSTVNNFDGFSSLVDGVLIFHGGDSNHFGSYLRLDRMPERFEYHGTPDGYDTLVLRHSDVDWDFSFIGLTRAEFLAAATIEVDPLDAAHYIISVGGELWGDLWHVDEIQFLTDDRQGQDRVVPSELAGVTDFTGTEGDDDIDGNNLDNLILGLEGDDHIRGLGGTDTIDGGPGVDHIRVWGGADHVVDGGADWDSLAVDDHTSPAIRYDFASGVVQGLDTLAPGGTVLYEVSVANIEGADIASMNHVEVIGAPGQDLWVTLQVMPTSLSIQGGPGQMHSGLGFGWIQNDDGSQGITLADFESRFEVVQFDPTGRNFDIIDLSDGSTFAELRGVSYIEFRDPLAPNAPERMNLAEIATGGNLIEGTAGDDTLDGTPDYDVILGFEGDDALNGGDGADELFSGSGNDTMEGGLGDDFFGYDGRTADTVTITDAGGTDTLVLFNYQTPFTHLGWGFEWDGTQAIRTMPNGHTAIIDGTGGAPVIEQIQWAGLDEFEEIEWIRAPKKLITDWAEFDQVNVVYAGNASDETLVAPDFPMPDNSWEMESEIYTNGGNDSVTLFEHLRYMVYAGDGDDVITAVQSATNTGIERHFAAGQAGNDIITLLGGDDIAIGGDGNDILTPGAGSDRAWGGDGDDIFHHTSNPGDSDEYYGGDGQDRLVVDLTSVDDPTSFIAEIDLVSGDMGARGATDGRDIVREIEEIELLGDVAADITGGFESNLFLTGGGDDTVWGGGGDDTVNTGAGDDDVFADAGNNVLDGGDGNDLLDFFDGTSEWTVVDMPGGTIQGRAGLDAGDAVYYTTTFQNFEDFAWGFEQSTKIIGTGGADFISFWLAPQGYTIIENTGGNASLNFTHAETPGGQRMNELDLEALVLRSVDGTGLNFDVFRIADNVRIAELRGVEWIFVADSSDPGEHFEFKLSEIAEPFVLNVEGTPEEDQTLSVDGDLLGDVGPISYQWTRDGADIPGATGDSYTLGQDDVGAEITVVVTFDGPASPLTAIGPVDPVANVNDLPTGTLEITGSALFGEELTAVLTDLADEDGVTAQSYQWLRDGVAIVGATNATYELASADLGAEITVQVRYTDGQGTPEALTSLPTAAVQLDPLAQLCDIEMGEHYQFYLLNHTVTDADTDGNPVFLNEFISDPHERDGFVTSAPAIPADLEAVMRLFGASVNDAGYGMILQDFEEDGAGDEDYASGNFAGAGHSYVAATGTTHDSAGGAMADGTAEGTLIVDGVMSLSLFNTGNAAAADPTNGDDPGVATNQGNDADRGFNLTPGGDQYLEALPGEDDDGGVLICFDQGTTVFGFSLNLMGREATKRDVFLDIHFSDGSVYRTLTDTNAHATGGEQFYAYVIDPTESSLSIEAVVLYEPFDIGAHDANSRDIFSIDDLGLVVASEDADLTVEDYFGALGINNPVQGAVTIEGTPEQGQQLAANIDTVSDADGIAAGAVVIQWLRNGTEIAGAIGGVYLLTQEDVGSEISVRVTFTDNRANDEVLTSVPTAAVSNVNDAPTGAVTIAGDPIEGQTLMAVTDTVDDADGMTGATLAYQWLRDGAPIAGATAASYELGQDDDGATITVQVSFTDDQGTDESLTSAGVGPVQLVNIHGTAGNNDLTDNALDNNVFGHAGNDQFHYTPGDMDAYDGGAGYDRMNVDLTGMGPGIFEVDFLNGTMGWLGTPTDTLTNIEAVRITGDVAASVTGNSANNTIELGGGDDTVWGGGGDDTVNTGAGDDEVLADAGSNVLDGGDGIDLLDFLDVTSEWTVVDMPGGTIQGRAGLDAGDAVYYTTTFQNFEDFALRGENALKIMGFGGADVFAPAQMPRDFLAIDNAGGAGLLDFTQVDNLDGSFGLTDADFADFTIRPVDGTGVNFNIYGDLGAGEVQVAELRGVANVQVLNSALPGANLLLPIVDLAEPFVLFVEGTPEEDQTLSVDGSLLGDPAEVGPISYQWTRDGEDIPGATGDSYTLGQDDVGAEITVVVTFTGPASPMTAIGPVDPVANVNDLPTGEVSITGTAAEGETLTAVTDAIDDEDGMTTPTYQWLRNGTAIAGATALTYLLTQEDVGAAISVQVSYTDDFGAPETVTSAETAAVSNVNDAPTGEVTITGTAIEGQTLMAVTDTIDDADGMTGATLAYQWLRDGAPIAGATAASYELGQDDDGATITVQVSFTDDQGTEESLTSAGVGPVQLVNINGTAGNDDLTDNALDNNVFGHAGNDQFHYTPGDMDAYDGGAGYDRMNVDLTGMGPGIFEVVFDNLEDSIDGTMGWQGTPTDTLRKTEAVRITGDVAASVTGNSANNTIELGDGNDTASGGEGNDAIAGGAGDDDLRGDGGDDFLAGEAGSDTIDGGEGRDVAEFAGAFAEYGVTEAGGTVTVTHGNDTDTITNVERFSFSDEFYTLGTLRILGEESIDSGGNTVDRSGETGDEEFGTGGGDDTVTGGSGNDSIDGGSGNDSVSGGDGNDQIFDTLGNDTIEGGAGRDQGGSLSGNNVFREADEATAAGDTTRDDYYAGGYGDDEFHGGGGNDVLVGDRGAVFYFGSDTLTGGTGDDILEGSGGADVFIFRAGDGNDTIGQVDLNTVSGAANIGDVNILGADFQTGFDQVHLQGFGYTTTADVLADISDVDGHAVLDTGNGTITFYDLVAANLDADDFVLI